MRIAFLNRGREAFPGGDAVALDATMEALRRRGHVADEIGWVAEKLVNYDLCHMMHCNFSWSLGNYNAIKKANKPYVLTPIYYPGPLLSGITQEQIIEIIAGSRFILPFSETEEIRIYQELNHLHGSRIIPNGTDPMFHHYSNPNAEGRGQTVLTVSARGPSDKGVPVIEKIRKQAGFFHFNASDLVHSSLSTCYPHFKVFINASTSERMSLTIGEALCAGCRVLATQENWGNSHYPGLVTFAPTDELNLEHLIRWALTSPDWDYRPNAAARCLTWDWVAEKLEAVYREVLGG